MKKMMIAVAMVCAAAFTQAATCSWSTSGLASAKYWYTSDGSTKMAGGSDIFLYCVSDMSQGDLLAGLRDGSIELGDDSFMSSTLSATAQLTAASKTTPGDKVGNQKFYMATMIDDQVFISDDISVAVQSTSDSSITFTGIATQTKQNHLTPADASYTTGGWYAVAPEPTSGLMMLLGLGALALRRRRA